MTALRRRALRTAPRARVVCLPHAGGAASTYLGWTEPLGEDIELAVAQYPGREDRLADAPYRTMPELVADLLPEVLALSGPLVLVGHSMGGAVAHELAQALHRAGRPPAHLVVSGRQPPRHHRGGDLHSASDDHLLAELRRLNPAGADILDHRELMALLLPTIRADYALIETYRPDDPVVLDAPVTVLRGVDDPELGSAEAADWSELTTGPCTVTVLPGDHFFVVAERAAVTAHVRHVALAACVSEEDR